MGWRLKDLAYCSNVHPGESLADIGANLERFVGPVREALAAAELGAGLWISNKASLATQNEADFQHLQQKLVANRLRLQSLNGFPFGDFHQEVIKASVYLPDWSERARLDYTVSLAKLLAACLPADENSGTISTLPLGFQQYWTTAKHQHSLINILRLVAELARLEKNTGKHIRVCLEMEPACVLEKTDDIVNFFNRDLATLAQEEKFPADKIRRYLGVCYDVCHQAVMFEDIRQSLKKIHDAGIVIGKIQLSSALRLTDCSAGEMRKNLQPFLEPRYLHQTSIRQADGRIDTCDDLPEALKSIPPEPGQEWRIHYHVPLQLNIINDSGLGTTQFATEQVFSFLAENRHIRPHLEVETYTWNVLPASLRADDDEALIRGIAAELDYVYDRLSHYGLLDKENNDTKAA
ncbi:MAG: metabolite traffic protein EboE [Gammaproteobacteria bacterium]|nr:metabolite traffic protein EboE [Gammaproteobacteria bacterium]